MKQKKIFDLDKMKHLLCIAIVAVLILVLLFGKCGGRNENFQDPWSNPPPQPYTQDCQHGIICQGKTQAGGNLGRLQVKQCIRGGSNSDNPNGWLFGEAMSCADPGTGPIGLFKSCSEFGPMTNYCDGMPQCSDVGKQCGLSNIANA